MKKFFEDFTKEEISRYKEFNFIPVECHDGTCLINSELQLSIYKHGKKIYSKQEEPGTTYYNNHSRIYVLASEWFLQINIERLLKDYKDGTLDKKRFDIYDYEKDDYLRVI